MRHAYLSGVFSLTLILQAFCIQPADLFTAFQEFLQSVASAPSIPRNGNSSMLSTDCIGRIDMIITLTGIESNSEFLYGVPNLVASSNTTQLIGVPLSATVESLSIQHSVVAASVIFYMHRGSPSMSPVPLQVDIWMHFTDDLKVDAYDFSSRRFDSYLDYAKVPLGDSISKSFRRTPTEAYLSSPREP
ncbi:hypothetical protein BDZ89DRAFT_1127638 [Hymenopellis radicata]|nr:hypothetical protein BDZ89DRAFT_1127638 [Hymenopellis radicata]